MSKMNSLVFGLGVLAGVIGGVVAGVLYAPKPGAETRKELKDAACQIAQENAPKIRKAKNDAMNAIELIKCRLESEYGKILDKIKAKKLAKAKSKEDGNYDFN